MFSLPARASDAGPDAVRHPVTCAVCGQTVPRDCTVPCQGSDDCCERICDDCAELGHEGSSYRCDGCHLYACPEHMVSDGDMRWCGVCRAIKAAVMVRKVTSSTPDIGAARIIRKRNNDGR